MVTFSHDSATEDMKSKYGGQNPRLLLNLQDFPVTLHSVHSDLIFFFWGAQSCRMLLAFVRMRMPYDACCPDFVCSVKKCKQPNMFHLVLLSFPELRPWTSKYCRKQTRWIHGQSAPQLFATWLSLALLKWRRTQKSLYGVAFPEFPELQGQKPIV